MKLFSFHNSFCFFGLVRNVSVTLFSAFLFSVTLTSCHTTQTITKEVPIAIHDTVIQNKIIHDSVFVDNYVKEYVKGDTVFVDRVSTKYVERFLRDTISVFKEVPVQTTVEEEKVVEEPLKWWQTAFIWIGVFASLAFVLYIVYRLCVVKIKIR